MDSNNDIVILLSGPVTISPVRSLPFDLENWLTDNLKWGERHQPCMTWACTFEERCYFFDCFDTGIVTDLLTFVDVDGYQNHQGRAVYL